MACWLRCVTQSDKSVFSQFSITSFPNQWFFFSFFFCCCSLFNRHHIFLAKDGRQWYADTEWHLLRCRHCQKHIRVLSWDIKKKKREREKAWKPDNSGSFVCRWPWGWQGVLKTQPSDSRTGQCKILYVKLNHATVTVGKIYIKKKNNKKMEWVTKKSFCLKALYGCVDVKMSSQFRLLNTNQSIPMLYWAATT